MPNFDDTCDKSAPGALVGDEAIWDAVREVAGGKVLLLDAAVSECDPAKVEWIPPKVLFAAGNDRMVPYLEGERPMDTGARPDNAATVVRATIKAATYSGPTGPVRLIEAAPRDLPMQLSTTANTRLPDGRMLDAVLAELADFKANVTPYQLGWRDRVLVVEAENERLAFRARIHDQRIQAISRGTVTQEMIEDNVFKAEELAALGLVHDPITGGWHPPGWIFDWSLARYSARLP